MSYTAVTRGIEVRVQPHFLADESDPDANNWFWAYTVRISNAGPVTVQVLRRTWRIINAQGRTQTVSGDGVIGEQPVLEPGEAFEYTSGTPLDTSSGIMAGSYHMAETVSGETFDAEIPTFSLDSTDRPPQVH